MADFLLELLSEEIPARMQAEAAEQLRARFVALLSAAGLSAEGVAADVTPRRLVLRAGGLPTTSTPTREERRGPRADAPEAAVAGFLKSTGLSRADLVERTDPRGTFLFAVIDRPGRPAADLLAEHLPALIDGFAWPKSQRWGPASVSTASPRWVRPLRGIVALLDADIVPFAALGVQSGRRTFGHRFMSAGPIDIDHAATHARQLRAAHVILSAAERAAIIRDGAERLAAAAGGTLIADPGLEAENAGLTEWPVPLAGRFDPAFLAVPREVIQLSMRTNQKYFALNDGNGALAPAFVCVANLAAADGGAAIIAGNERVLSARLADARFFWEQDRAVPLDDLLPRLDQRLYFEGMGTMLAKAARNEALAGDLWQRLGGDPADGALARRAALLAKADLVSATVGEFPELQGIVGGHVAAAFGEPADLVAAIAEHYGSAPSNRVSICVGLADRIDTLAAFFARGRRPTGSRDPFALRRAALHMIHIIVGNRLRLPLTPVFAHALAALPPGEGPAAADAAELVAFLVDRLKVQQREAGVRHDLIDAVAGDGREDDLVRLLDRVAALGAFLSTEDGANLLAGYGRAANILRIEEDREGRSFAAAVDRALLVAPAEVALADALAAAQAAATAALAAEDFTGAMRALAALRREVDLFFADVTVNADDEGVRANRLALLAMLRDTADRVADFSGIGC